MPAYFAYRCIQVFGRTVGCLFWGVRAEGRDRIPKTGPVILATTHESYLDPFLVGSYAPRHTWYMARRTLFFKGERRSRLRTWFGHLWGIIEVEREGTGIGALRGAEERLAEGFQVLIFPEGTRSPDGEVREFRAGVGLLARRSRAAVVPVSIDGTRRLWPKGAKLPTLLRRRARIVFGEPVTYDETTDPRDAAADIRRRVLELRTS